MNWLFIKERESQRWFLYGPLPTERYKDGRKVRFIQRTYPYPKPEAASPFVESHMVIKAETEVEAWQNLNSR